jgi:hypothetical protein
MFESGQVLQDRYQLQQKLGQTMAGRQTWLAVDFSTQPNESVVLKLLAFSVKEIETWLASSFRVEAGEAKIAAA